MSEPENHTLAWMRRIDAKLDRVQAERSEFRADIKGDVTVLTGIVLRLEGRDSGLPIELAGVRQQLAALQRRLERLERQSGEPEPAGPA
jgi:hypothetical protein